jgi:predicted Rossmann fold flavoprotein
MEKFSVGVIGGGASGIMAAISSKRKGRSVVICEKMQRLGNKILVTGGGRCNLLNENLDESFYTSTQEGLVKVVFSRFGKIEIKNFFKELGLRLYSEDGRVFPVTNQAASVAKVLELEVTRASIPVELNFEVTHVISSGKSFILFSKENKKIECSSLILAGGGKAYPALGSDGSCFRFARQFGHHFIGPVPSAVPLVAKDKWCHLLQGQKILAQAKGIIDGKVMEESSGEVLFTKYGLSGTAILDVSESISIALNRMEKNDVQVAVDLIPFMSGDQLKQEISQRIKKGLETGYLLAGILPNKFGLVIKDFFNEHAQYERVDVLSNILKDKRFKVIGTRGWNEAEFTCGGVDAREVKKETLESKFRKGLYFAGEILDVQGKRGGYNLAWAWASGFVAGLTE